MICMYISDWSSTDRITRKRSDEESEWNSLEVWTGR